VLGAATRAAVILRQSTVLRVHLHRLRREIAAAASSWGSLDVQVLTGSAAENSSGLRCELVSSLSGLLGVQLDDHHSQKPAHDA
jgi:acetate kinase